MYGYAVRSRQGMTLIELVIVIAIMGILIVLAYPSVQQWLERSEADRVHQTVLGVLRQAKMSSYTYHKNVVFCLADENKVCNKNSSHQLLLFFDKNDNHRFDKADESMIYQEMLNLSYGRVFLRVGGRNGHYVKFWQDTGTPKGFQGHVSYCPHSSNQDLMYQISFNLAGGIRFKPFSIKKTDC